MSAAHTSGPWVVHEEDSDDLATTPRIFVLWPLNKGRIAELSGYATRERRANARLISAAPDLLEALIGVLRVTDRKTDEFDAARAAIAKAGVPTVPNPPRFEEVFCSSCGGGFGPGDFGFSGCDTHAGKRRTS